jgi:hypothetical protein
MYATAHLDLVRETVAEQVRNGARASAGSAAEAAITPARIRIWGPRASRRPAQVALADVIHLPAPRDTHPVTGSRAGSVAVLLDA